MACICSMTHLDQVGHRRLDSEPLELGRNLASVIGGMVDDLPQNGPRGQHRGPPTAAEGPGGGQVLRGQQGCQVLEDPVSPIEQPLSVIHACQFSLGRHALHHLRPATPRSQPSVTTAMCTIDERTDDPPGTGSAPYCSAVSFRQASRMSRSAQRL